MGGVSSVDARQAFDEPDDATLHDAQVPGDDTWDAAGSTGADEASDVAADAPDTDEAVALVATELRLRLGAVAASARDYAGRAKAANTLRAYRADWADFTAWCARYALPPLPAAPETVALYLAALADAGRKASTLQHARPTLGVHIWITLIANSRW